MVGEDGIRLLELVWSEEAPPLLRELAQVEVLCQTWIQQFVVIEGKIRRRDPTTDGTELAHPACSPEARVAASSDRLITLATSLAKTAEIGTVVKGLDLTGPTLTQ